MKCAILTDVCLFSPMLEVITKNTETSVVVLNVPTTICYLIRILPHNSEIPLCINTIFILTLKAPRKKTSENVEC